MNRQTHLLAVGVTAAALLLLVPSSAQQPAPAPQKTMSQSLGLVVFPAKGQTADVQKKDEFGCYDWAKQQTGFDPMAPAPASTPVPVQAKQGGAVKGAAKGAAAGAAIGAIAGDTGTGAGVGAAAGAMKGRQKQKQANAQAQQQSAQQAAATDQAKVDQYKKAFSACMEGKGYTVK